MTIRIIHGPNEGHFDVKGKTLRVVAKALREVFNIPKDAVPWIGGEIVSLDRILNDGESVEFVKEYGQKGGLQDLWSEAELLMLFGHAALDAIKQNGFNLRPHLAATASEVIAWQHWLQDRSTEPSKTLPIEVDIKSERLIVNGVQYELEQDLAAVVQCLLDAKGEPRSTTQMKLAYPQWIVDERLDIRIRRKLRQHKSGIGHFLKSDKKGYRLVMRGCE
jgi:hypothetical protein